MSRPQFLLLLAILSGQFVAAQQSKFSLGDIPLEDLAFTVYEKDSSAQAVVLYDFFKVTENPGNGYIIERHVRIKILGEEGFAWGDVQVPVYSYAPQFNIKASTHYLEDSRITSVPMSKESIVRQKISNGFSLLTFSFPQVRKGAVIEYWYSIKSLRYAGWQFQTTIPVRQCEFWAGMPNTGVLHSYVQGTFKPTEYTFKETPLTELYHWAYENVPAFKEEPMINNKKNYVGSINFSYLRSWEQFNADLVTNKFFFDHIKGNHFLKKFATGITQNLSDPLQKIDTIYHYIQNRYTKVLIQSDGLNLKNTFQSSIGSPLEINMLLASMLNKIGFETHIILLSTIANGTIKKEFPAREQFDYAVCGVTLENKLIILDASEKNLPLGFLPEQFVNEDGFIVSDKEPGWIPLNFFPSSKTTVNAEIQILDDGSLSGLVGFSRDGYDGVNARNELSNNDENSFVRNFVSEQGWKINRSWFENIKTTSQPLKDSYDVIIKNENSGGKMLYVTPVIAGAIKSNPFSDTQRTYPISFPANREFVYMASLSIPDGYEIDELPKSVILKLADSSAKFVYSASKIGRVIQIMCSLKRERTLYQPQEYLQLKEFYAHVVSKSAEQVVLRRK